MANAAIPLTAAIAENTKASLRRRAPASTTPGSVTSVLERGALVFPPRRLR